MSADARAWLDGTVLPAATAALPATDLGLRQGLGVFETLRVRSGRAAGAELHLARLEDGGHRLGIDVDRGAVLAGIAAVLDGAPDVDLLVRITVTAGDAAPDWPPVPAGRPRVLVTRGPAPALPAPAVDAVVVAGPRAPAGLGDVKTTSYAGSVLAQRRARARGAEVALLEDDGAVREAADGNVLALHGTTLTTPPADGRILAGVTRRLVLDLAPGLGLAVREVDLARPDLDTADLVLVSSAVRRLRPVRRVDGTAVAAGDGAHPVVARLLAGLEDLATASEPLRAPRAR